MAAVISVGEDHVEFQNDPGVTPALNYAAVEAARLVRQARNTLIETSPSVTTDMLTHGRMSTANTTRQWIHRHRSSGRLITVDDDGRTLIPAYQLGEAFDLKPDVADITKVLTKAGMTSWAIWRWYTTHNGWLEDSPLAVLEQDGVDALQPALDGLLSA